MPRPRELLPCSLHVLVSGTDTDRSDAPRLAGALGSRLSRVTIAVWSGTKADVDLATIERAAALADDIEVRTGLRPTYVELHGDLADALGADLMACPGTAVVAVHGTMPRRLRNAVRRAAARSRAHVALVPVLEPDELEPVR